MSRNETNTRLGYEKTQFVKINLKTVATNCMQNLTAQPHNPQNMFLLFSPMQVIVITTLNPRQTVPLKCTSETEVKSSLCPP